jgi:hypothetical protein
MHMRARRVLRRASTLVAMTSPADEQQATSPALHDALQHLGFLVGR